MQGIRSLSVILAFRLLSPAQDFPFADTKSLLWRAQELEEQGKTTAAWLLYSQVSKLDRDDNFAAGKAAQLQTKALAGAKLNPQTDPAAAVSAAQPDPGDPLIRITDRELREGPKLLPPPSLEPATAKTLTLNLSSDGKTIYNRFLANFGIEVIFDGDYDNPTTRQIRLENASFDEALYVIGLVTNSFVIPLSAKLAMVVRDNDQKRRDQERVVSITLPIPTAISSPEAQEMARGIQQIFELQRVAIDTVRGIMLIRDRWSKVKPAQLALEQMLNYRGQVMMDVEFYEVAENSSYDFGFSLPNQSQLIPLVRRANLIPAVVNGFRTAIGFGGGASLFGLGITSARLFASMTYSNTKSLYRAETRSLDGLPATLHIGDRYPIVTATSTIATASSDTTQYTVPQIQFEDLGLTLKITPHVHANNEVSMEVDTEFKVLTGRTNNDIPVIANRKYTGTVRLKEGEWAVAAGLITRSETRSIGGIAGLASIPLLGPGLSTNGRTRGSGQTLLVIRPHIISMLPPEFASREIWTGAETRFLAPVR